MPRFYSLTTSMVMTDLGEHQHKDQAVRASGADCILVFSEEEIQRLQASIATPLTPAVQSVSQVEQRRTVMQADYSLESVFLPKYTQVVKALNGLLEHVVPHARDTGHNAADREMCEAIQVARAVATFK